MLCPHHCDKLNLFTLSLSAGKKEHILFPVKKKNLLKAAGASGS